MFLFSSILTTLSSIAVFIAGLLAFLRNPKKPQNIRFFTLTSLIALWIPFNFIDSNVVKRLLTNLSLKFDFAIALCIGWALLEFVKAYAADQSTRTVVTRWFSPSFRVLTFLLNVFFIIPILFGRVVNSSISMGTLQVHYGQTFSLYVALLMFYLVYAFIKLFSLYGHTTKKKKRALNLITIGFLMATIANVFTNLVFPLLIHTRATVQELNVVGYIGFFVLVLFVYLAITSQKLFDIRAFVLRSVVYLFTFSVIALLYVLPVVLLSTYLVHAPLKLSTILYLVPITLIVAMLFQPLRLRFNRATNKFFFRDYYEPQQVLDELSSLLVGSVEVEQIKNKSGEIISEALKPKFLRFGLYSDHSTEDKQILSHLFHSNQNIIVLDELDSHKYEALYETMNKHDVAIAIRLRTTHEELGFMLLGYKQSGSVYTESDKLLLGIVADTLAISMQSALRFREIQNFNVTLQDKIEKATNQLRKANQRLKALDETKDDFISMASHQLRTPLTSVKGYVSMVLDGDVGKVTSAQRKLLNQAFISSQHMVYLIADLLNVSRLRTGKFVIESAPVNLATIIAGEVEQLTETAISRKLTLTYKKPAHFPTLMLDENKIRQVAMNFMDNAIYYTPAGGHITVSLTETDKAIEYTVSDDGIGVPRHDQAHLFSKFYRAGNARKARPDGTGLGLFMAKKVIVAQGGAIVFRSQEGKGSTFGFTFPKAALAQPSKS